MKKIKCSLMLLLLGSVLLVLSNFTPKISYAGGDPCANCPRNPCSPCLERTVICSPGGHACPVCESSSFNGC